MERIATVISADRQTALVQIRRASACGENCAACSANCKKTRHTAQVKNTAGAKEGQRVKVEMEGRSLVFLSFLAYIVPLLALILGYAVSFALLRNEIWADVIGLLCLVLSFLILRQVDKRIEKSGKYQSEITKILSE